MIFYFEVSISALRLPRDNAYDHLSDRCSTYLERI